MAAVTRLGLYGGPRGLYGDFSGKAAAAVQMSGSTGFAWTPTGDLDVEATLSGNTGWDTDPTGSLDVEASLAGSTGFTWTPSGNLNDGAVLTDEVFPLFYKVLIDNNGIFTTTRISNRSFSSTIITLNMSAQVTISGDHFAAVRL